MRTVDGSHLWVTLVDNVVGPRWWIPSMDPFSGTDCRIPLVERVDRSLDRSLWQIVVGTPVGVLGVDPFDSSFGGTRCLIPLVDQIGGSLWCTRVMDPAGGFL